MMNSLTVTVVVTFLLVNSTMSLFLPLMQGLFRQYQNQRFRFREEPGNGNILPEYDFIVVGAGSGGSVVTNRLTEIEGWNVLLLEAGMDTSIYTDIPAVVSYLQFTDYNWGYKAEKADGICLAMDDERCIWPRGKGMGGTSIINYMIYTRGNKQDYDRIAEYGNPGWSYEDVFPYFLKSEKCIIKEFENSSSHSKDGYVYIDNIHFRSRSADRFLGAASELGYTLGDYNAPETSNAFSRLQSTQKFGRRVSASKAFLEPIKDRRNFHVVQRARATKIIIDKNQMKAIGVEFVKNRIRKTVYASKEVIISAGTLNSPQLLMLSGIGPEESLKKVGIETIQDLQVGRNLHDHVTTGGIVFTVNNTDTLTEVKTQSLEALLEWWYEGTGYLSIPGGAEAIGYVNTKYNKKGNFPDVEVLFINGGLASDKGNTVRKSWGVSDDFYNAVYKPLENLESISIWPVLLRPKSRGKVELRSKNPFHWPLLYLDHFKDTSDLDVLVEGIKEILKFKDTAGFRSMNATLNPTPYPGCANHTFMSDEYWRCSLRHMTLTLHHQGGTCKMGPRADPTAVVDHELRVHGISNLRVVDASIFPTIPCAHLHAPTMMVGEKAADMIKNYWLNKNELETTDIKK